MSEMGFELPKSSVILVGKPEVTSFMDSDNKPYYRISLVSPVMVHCSVDPAIEAVETDEVFMRERDVEEQDFTLVDPADPAKGYYIPKWVVDFSKAQELCLYQETTIKRWIRENRKERSDERRTSINERIKARMAKKDGN